MGRIWRYRRPELGGLTGGVAVRNVRARPLAPPGCLSALVTRSIFSAKASKKRLLADLFLDKALLLASRAGEWARQRAINYKLRRWQWQHDKRARLSTSAANAQIVRYHAELN